MHRPPKGRPSAASPNATTSTSSTLSTSEKDLKRTVSSDRGPTAADASRDAKKRTASEGGMSESRKPIEKTDVSSNPPVDGPKEPITEDPGKADDQGVQKSGSSPSSPEYGTTSTSTLPKEEDISSNGNGSSESTWDKQSQSSQNGMNSDKLESDQQTEPVAAPAWDEEASATPSFKEAAPPALNVWQQRIEIQNAAKAKTKQVPTQQPKSPTGSTGHAGVNGLGRGSDIAGESRKQEVRKKGKTVTEEKPGADGGKVTTKEGKRRSSDDGAKAARRRNDATMQNEDPALMATTAAVAPPPPPGDSSSWPTPDNAAGEEKKRPQPQQKHNDGEKEKDTPKPSGKKGWTPIPFVPTPVFNTPLPQARRGGRGPSGGNRDNPPRGRNNAPSANGSEKTGNANTSANTVQSTTNDRSAKPKRASSAGPISGKEQRKASENFVTERRKDIFNEDGPPGQTKKPASNDSKRQVAVPVPATPQIVRSPGRATESERNPLPKPMGDNYHSTENESQNFGFDAHSQSRDHGPERRSEGSVRPGDLAKDFQGSFSGKDRGEERPSRGRGGRGGRGGANQPAYNGHLANGNAYSNGQAYQYQPSYAPQQRSFSNHERIPSQSQGNFFGPSSPHRSYRASSRSQFNSGYMSTSGRFSNGPSSGPSHLPSIHTDLANMSAYQPGAQGIMSAIPYNPYEEHVTLFDMVTMQMEYYFSLDNLCKDMFLRKHMDSQGWVFLSVLAGFNRIVALTTDLEMIRYVCFNSQKIELKPGQVWQDGRDRLRARDTWKSFVLNKDQRDPTAQHDGPALASGAPRDDSMPRNDDQHAVSPRTNASNGPLDFPYQSLNAIAPSAAQHAPSNAKVNGNHTDFSQPPLSAAVSEFTPSVHSHPSRRFALPDTRANETKLFTDEDVQHLQILVRQPINSAHPPFHSASSRTFSNGSIDGRNLNDELSELAERQSRPVNGEVFERWVHDRLPSSLYNH